MSLVSKTYVSAGLIYVLTKLFLCFILLLDTMIWWWHCHFQVFLLTSSDCSEKLKCAPYFLFCVRHIFGHFHSHCTHPAATAPVPLFCSFHTISHCAMLYCPNPSCKRNLRKAKKHFPSAKSFSNHVQQSPQCKAFVLVQTALSAPTMQAPSKQASINTTTQLFKKQRLRLNPTFSQQQ